MAPNCCSLCQSDGSVKTHTVPAPDSERHRIRKRPPLPEAHRFKRQANELPDCLASLTVFDDIMDLSMSSIETPDEPGRYWFKGCPSLSTVKRKTCFGIITVDQVGMVTLPVSRRPFHLKTFGSSENGKAPLIPPDGPAPLARRGSLMVQQARPAGLPNGS